MAPLQRIRGMFSYNICVSERSGESKRFKSTALNSVLSIYVEYFSHSSLVSLAVDMFHSNVFFVCVFVSVRSNVPNRRSHCASRYSTYVFPLVRMCECVFETWPSVPIHLHASLLITFQPNCSEATVFVSSWQNQVKKISENWWKFQRSKAVSRSLVLEWHR